MLLLKLLLVPSFLLLVSLAGKRWGAPIAGWLAGLPLVAGPILYFLALEQGPQFAAGAASAALAAILASVSFSVAYAHGCQRFRWPGALLGGMAAWLAAATLLARAPDSVVASALIALAALLLAPHAFPAISSAGAGHHLGRAEMVLRMLAGALLTMGVTLVATTLGPRWSGLLAVFPVLGSVLAVFSHRAQGAAFAAVLLRSMATGLYSFLAFCLVLAVLLPRWGTAAGFAGAAAVSLAVQAATRRRISKQ
ncbi:MAG: hypothetical protein ACN6O3_11040 [Comamonas sp.]